MSAPCIEIRPCGLVHGRAAVPESGCHLLHPCPHLRTDGNPLVIGPHGYPEVFKRTPVQRGQFQAVPARHDFIGPRHGPDRGLEVMRGTREGADDGNVRLAAQVPGRRVAADPEQVPGGLVAEDAAVVGGIADGAADVGAGFDAGQPRRQRGRGTARGTAGDAAVVERIVGGAVHLVVALEVREHERNVGLAEDDGPGLLEFLDGLGVFPGDVVPPVGVAPGGRRAGQVIGLLEGHRHAVQRTRFAAGSDSAVGVPSLLDGLFAHVHHQGVQRIVVPVDPFQVVAQDLFAAEFPGADPRRDFGCGQKGKFAHGQSGRMGKKPILIPHRLLQSESCVGAIVPGLHRRLIDSPGWPILNRSSQGTRGVPWHTSTGNNSKRAWPTSRHRPGTGVSWK